MWAVGATLFAMLAGEPVHAGGTPNEQLGRAMAVPARSLRSVRPDLPRVLIEVVDRALEYEPSRRWPSAAAMREALRRANAGGARPSARTRVRNAAIAVMSVAAVVAAVAWLEGRVTPKEAARPVAAASAPASAVAQQAHEAQASARAYSEAAPANDTAGGNLAEAATAAAPVKTASRLKHAGNGAKPSARGRMLQGAPHADADRRSPPGYVAPPPNLFETRY